MAGIAERDAAAGEANLTEQRHIEAARDAVKSLTFALEGIERRVPIDLCAIDLTAAWEALGLITGKTANEELITRIFESFCLGK
jgi:tRNA modification GTPase